MPGKSRLARRLLGSFLKIGNVTVHSRDGSSFLVPSLTEPIGFYLLVDGVYEPTTAAFLSHALTLGSSFVDVGANIGVFAILGARKVGNAGKVVAVEPSRTIFPYLTRNVQANNCVNISTQHCAAYDSGNGLHAFYEAPPERFGMGSLAPQFSAQPTWVYTRRLDSILTDLGMSHVDILKIDVEGFEAAVLRGARHLLRNCDGLSIIFEFCDWAEARVPQGCIGDSQRVLRSYDYSIWRLEDFLKGKAPLKQVLTSGCEILVARKGVH